VHFSHKENHQIATATTPVRWKDYATLRLTHTHTHHN